MGKVEDQPDVRPTRDVKQVILIRRDLGMRRGKEIAQGSHASMAFLTNAVREWWSWSGGKTGHILGDATSLGPYFTPAQRIWIESAFAKVTLQVSSEEELIKYYDLAREKGLTAHIITDSGRTEFHGEPTYTAVAIGPDYVDLVDKVTGELKLY